MTTKALSAFLISVLSLCCLPCHAQSVLTAESSPPASQTQLGRQQEKRRKEAEQAVHRPMNPGRSAKTVAAILLPTGVITMGIGLAVYYNFKPLTTPCFTDCRDRTYSGDITKAVFAASGVAGGIVTLLGGAYLIYGLSQPALRPTGGLAGVYVAPYIGPDATGLLAVGRF